MAEPSINNIATMLENLLRILKEEHVFNRSGDQRVIQFLHPEKLQVNIIDLSCPVKKLVSCVFIRARGVTSGIFVNLFYTYAEILFYILILYLLMHLFRIFLISVTVIISYVINVFVLCYISVISLCFNYQ